MAGEQTPAQNPIVVVVELAAQAGATEQTKSFFKATYGGSIVGATMIADLSQVNANSTSAYASFQVIKTATVAFSLSLGVLNSTEAIPPNGGTALVRVSQDAATFLAGEVLQAKVAKTGAGFATVAGRLAASFIQGAVVLE